MNVYYGAKHSGRHLEHIISFKPQNNSMSKLDLLIYEKTKSPRNLRSNIVHKGRPKFSWFQSLCSTVRPKIPWVFAENYTNLHFYCFQKYIQRASRIFPPGLSFSNHPVQSWLLPGAFSSYSPPEELLGRGKKMGKKGQEEWGKEGPWCHCFDPIPLPWKKTRLLSHLPLHHHPLSVFHLNVSIEFLCES